jgi:hypothetical protein
MTWSSGNNRGSYPIEVVQIGRWSAVTGIVYLEAETGRGNWLGGA